MNFLDKLKPIKRAEIERLKAEPPSFKQVGPRPSLITAIQNRPPSTRALIAEIKLHSPSKGPLQNEEAIETILPLYNRYATGISVLTDEHFFNGSFARLNRIAQQSTLPLLCKDFVLDPFQIRLAQQAGASAILLIAKLLSATELQSLARTAREHQLNILCEIHDEEDLEKALTIQPKLIGINHRDLETLKIDMETSHRLRPQIPKGTLVVAESGIETPKDVAQLPPVDAILVGTSLMSAQNPESLIHSLCHA